MRSLSTVLCVTEIYRLFLMQKVIDSSDTGLSAGFGSSFCSNMSLKVGITDRNKLAFHTFCIPLPRTIRYTIDAGAVLTGWRFPGKLNEPAASQAGPGDFKRLGTWTADAWALCAGSIAVNNTGGSQGK
jgi:hypothetical protein